MDKHLVPDYEGLERWDLFGEGRRRCPRIGQILVAVPWARDASVDDLAFSKGSVLVLADIGDGCYAAIVFEYRDALTAVPDGMDRLRFDIRLQGEGETPFFTV